MANNPIVNIFRVKELRERVIFTFIVLAVFRLGSVLTIPGINPQALTAYFDSLTRGNAFVDYMDFFAGGAFSNFSVFMLGVMPYISTQIIMQLALIIFPSLKRIAQEDGGQKKVQAWTRIGTVFVCLIQSLAVTVYATSIPGAIVLESDLAFKLIAMITVTTGTMITIWLGEQITARGIGNGISMIIFGGIHRIARVSGVIVPVMALGYIVLALGVVLFNLGKLPDVIRLIVSNAFGWEQALGGGIGATLMQGIKRGLFSNEAGMGSAPNVAATAHVTHPVKQGLIQALGVFTDTLIICTCTAFIILFSGVSTQTSLNGIQLTQEALTAEVGSAGGIFIALAILLFAFSSIIGNYYYGEANILFITRRKPVLVAYRLLVSAMVLCGSLMSLDLAWSLADIMMGLMTICNLIAIAILSRQAFLLLDHYLAQKRKGISSPVFRKEDIPELEEEAECW